MTPPPITTARARSGTTAASIPGCRIAPWRFEPCSSRCPELRDAQHVEPLPGGLTNTNYKVIDARRPVRHPHLHKDSGLLAIDRENELHNTIARRRDGRRRAVRRVAARARRARDRLPRGEVLSRRDAARAAT